LKETEMSGPVYFDVEEAAKGECMSATGNVVGQVLVVEDEPLVRLNARDEIEAAGFEVYEAYNADEAIRLLEAHPAIGLVFTDVDMPGSMDGVKLAHFVRTRWPPVKIIVTSGYQHVTPDQLPAGSVFLRKPYQPEQLKREIDRLLEA
jgi:two-component system, response regulator PdtaR